MLEMSEVRDPVLLTSIWSGMPLPSIIAPELRIYLRVLQLILRRRLGRHEDYERADLERLIAEAESDDNCQLVIAVAGAMLAIHLGGGDPGLAIRSVASSIKAARRLPRNEELESELSLQTGLLGLLWAIPAWIQSEPQFEQWFAAVRDLAPDEVQQWLKIPFAGQASEAVCGGVWTRAADLPASDRNWEGVREQLERLRVWARSTRVAPLATSAVRSQIIVLAEYEQDLHRADSLARAAMEELGDLPESQFSIADTIARQHYYFGEAADALRWFETAFAHQESAKAAARVGSLTLAGIAAQPLNLDLSRRYLEEAVAVAAANGIRGLPGVTARGELGILLWTLGLNREAYATWSSAVQELLEGRQDKREWKTLFRLIGSCTGYFLGRLHGAPARDAAVPFSGILLREIKDIDQLYSSEDDWLLMVQMAQLAESIGAYDEALKWARITEIGSGTFESAGRALLDRLLIADKIANHKCVEIIRDAADIGDLDESEQSEGSAELDDKCRAERVARLNARLNLVALAIEVARTGLQDRAAAEIFAHSAAELSRDRAARHLGSRMWFGAVEVFEALEHRRVAWRELWNKAAAAREAGNSALQVMYAVAATAVAGPNEAAQIQLQIVPWLEKMFSPTLYHVTVAKFVPEYWQWAVDQCPMRFGSLTQTRRTIANAQALAERAAIHTILHAVAFSLGTRVPDDIQEWLDDHQP
jgi:hypothetical protein